MKMNENRFVFILVAWIALVFTGGDAVVQIDTETHMYVDQSGGSTRFFHGVNAVYKIPPWYPKMDEFDALNSLSAKDMEFLNMWGMNVIRLGVMWPGVNPSPGFINSTYLNIMKELVTALGDHDIFVIIDLHQDVLSRKFCGEGIPDHLVTFDDPKFKFPMPVQGETVYPVDSHGYPDLDTCLKHQFATYYFSLGVGETMQNLWSNVNGLQDEWITFWKSVATTFKDVENVLGYELINEPWLGNQYAEPELLIPGKADKKYAMPAYKNAHEAIRGIDDSHIIFYEPVVSDIAESGFDEGPGGPPYDNRQSYSYHVYCASGKDHGDPSSILFCNMTDEYYFDIREADAKRVGGGSFITEFGAMDAATIAVESYDFVTGKADDLLTSWAYWQYKYFQDLTTAAGPQESLFNRDGSIQEDKLRALSRTYAHIVQGVPKRMRFHPSTGDFILMFELDQSMKLPTKIYLNEDLHYPNGYTVSVKPERVVWKMVGKNFIEVSVPSGSAVASGGDLIAVEISRK